LGFIGPTDDPLEKRGLRNDCRGLALGSTPSPVATGDAAMPEPPIREKRRFKPKNSDFLAIHGCDHHPPGASRPFQERRR
jgi:hypothetical protein